MIPNSSLIADVFHPSTHNSTARNGNSYSVSTGIPNVDDA